MKLATSLAAALVLLCAGSVLAVGFGSSLDAIGTQAQKDAAMIGEPDPEYQVGGDTIATAANIPVLPYTDAGNTCTFNHDYNESCPYTTPGSPDVVYKYSPAADMAIDIDLCSSLYDTKVYVYENDEFTPIACNDDVCGDDGWKSALYGVPVLAGNTYYIVVDGYGSASCGEYDIEVTEFVPCFTCPPGASLEGEPFCGNDYDDQFNGGCNSTPPVFSSVPCSTTPGGTVSICGVGGGFDYFGGSYRDTDWYELDATYNTAGVNACLSPVSIDMILGYITPADCSQISTFDDYVIVTGCTTGCLFVPSGNMWIFVGSASFGSGVGCWDYILDITGYDCGSVAVEPSSWGSIKENYR